MPDVRVVHKKNSKSRSSSLFGMVMRIILGEELGFKTRIRRARGCC
jgi:hypothetical protein